MMTPSPSTLWQRWVARSVIVLLVVVGCYEHLWVLGHVVFNSDEAIMLLQTKSILHGHFVSFYWGQFYGAGQPYVAAPLVALLGSKAWALRCSGVVLAATASFIVWRVAKRCIESQFLAAAIAALSFAIPSASVVQLTYAYGFRPLTVLCVWLVILVAAKASHDSNDSLWWWALLGLVAGVGWWSSPEIVWGYVPALLVIGPSWWTSRDWSLIARSTLATALGFIAGACVWLWVTVTSHGATLKPQAAPVGHLVRLKDFFVYVLPMVFGIRVPGSGAYTLHGALLTWVVYVAMLVALTASCVVALRRGGLARALGFTAAVSPIIFLLDPATWYWQDGRYAIYLAPLYLVVLGIGLEALLARRMENTQGSRSIIAAALVIGCMALGLMSFHAFEKSVPTTAWFAADDGATSAAQALVGHGVTAGWADYWLAYRLDAFSNGQLHLSAIPGDLDRVLSDRLITQARRPATWLFSGGGSGVAPSPEAMGPAGVKFGHFEHKLRALGVSWRAQRVAGLWVIELDKVVNPRIFVS